MICWKVHITEEMLEVLKLSNMDTFAGPDQVHPRTVWATREEISVPADASSSLITLGEVGGLEDG